MPIGVFPVVPKTDETPDAVIFVTLLARELAVYTPPKGSTTTEIGPAPVFPKTVEGLLSVGFSTAVATVGAETNARSMATAEATNIFLFTPACYSSKLLNKKYSNFYLQVLENSNAHLNSEPNWNDDSGASRTRR